MSSSSSGSRATAAASSCPSGTRPAGARPTAAAATCSTRSRAPTWAPREACSSSTSTSPTTPRAPTTRSGPARSRRRRTGFRSRFEPARRSRRSDSNRRHLPYKGSALPAELLRRAVIVAPALLSILDTARPRLRASSRDGVQCKTGRLRNGAVTFATASTYAHHRSPRVIRRTYEGEVDLFAVYCPETAGVYLIPIGDVPTRSFARLRVEPSRNNQYRHVRLAAQYEIGRVDFATAEPGARAGASGSSA